MSRFVIRKVNTGTKFDLFAANGEKILTSEVYSSQAACLRGIESVRKNAPAAPLLELTAPDRRPVRGPRFELYQDKADRFRFRLRSRNGKTIAVSDAYVTKAGCRDGIESVRINAAIAAIEKGE